MKRAFIAMPIICIFFSVANTQTPPPAGDLNEIWLDVSYSGKEPGKIEPKVDFSLNFYVANAERLGANTNGFRMWSPDGVTWSYRTDPAWYGSYPGSRGVTAKHVSISGRWVGAYEDGIWPIIVPNPLLGGSAGPVEDSIMIAGVAIFTPGLPAGPLENLVQLNMTMGTNEGTWCVDSVSYFPSGGNWVFSTLSGGASYPTFVGPFCWRVGDADYPCADANQDTNNNVADAVHIINWIFKGGPPPECP
jgi:hypothetical protein